MSSSILPARDFCGLACNELAGSPAARILRVVGDTHSRELPKPMNTAEDDLI
ncbi:MAG: hypothetical protein JO251_10110 [Verrucomicrobia bacterium]|nr:hypothetical protein [Verrucomicrobiota bacterium]